MANAGPRPLLLAVVLACALAVGGCATTLVGIDAPKPSTSALADWQATALGQRFEARGAGRPELSGFYLLDDGARSFALRLRIAERAQKTLDLQYFALQQDDTGLLLLNALLAAADRGVRVRLLIDDALGADGDSKIRALAAHPNIEIRIFNPFLMRQELAFLRGVEYLLEAGRVNYRMHNKLFIGDNAIAVAGGRNIGDEYFHASSAIEFGDFDLAIAGPLVRNLSRSFDVYWNDRLAVPVESMPMGMPTEKELDDCRAELAGHFDKMSVSDYYRALPRTNQLDDMMSGKVPMIWARAIIAFDTPDKAAALSGERPGHLMWNRVARAAEAAKNELIIVSPYLVPGQTELELLHTLRERGVRVRILTNSLASTDMPIVHAGYRRYRVGLLQDGVELYETRPQPDQAASKAAARESGRSSGGGFSKTGKSGMFALHAKVFVIDRQRVFLGSMNFDRRSLRINTEIGVIIDSPQLAREVARRFDAIVDPSNSYRLALDPNQSAGEPALRWHSADAGEEQVTTSDPGVNAVKRSLIETLSLLPLDDLL